MIRPKIFVSTYRKYNHGNGAGEWVSVPNNEERFLRLCADVHSDEDNPEFMYLDWVDVPASLIRENHVDDALFDAVDYMETLHRDDVRRAFLIWLSSVEIDDVRDDLGTRFEDAYMGEYASEREFAEEWLDDMDVPEPPRVGNITLGYDHDMLARDLFNTDYFFCDGHVFKEVSE